MILQHPPETNVVRPYRREWQWPATPGPKPPRNAWLSIATSVALGVLGAAFVAMLLWPQRVGELLR